MFQIPFKAKKEKSIIKMTKAETLTWLVYPPPPEPQAQHSLQLWLVCKKPFTAPQRLITTGLSSFEATSTAAVL